MITMKYTAQKNKFSIKGFFSKCDQILRNLRIWSHLLEKSLMENLIFCAVIDFNFTITFVVHDTLTFRCKVFLS